MPKQQKTIQEELKELEALAAWFEKEEDFDVELGLKKVKEGAALAKKLKARLKEVENEFRELEGDLTSDDSA